MQNRRRKNTRAYAQLACAVLSVLLLLGCTDPASPRSRDARPNILLVLVDDLRFDAFGFTGYPLGGTPNIDRLAAEGGTFQNAFVTFSLCSPSRATMLTGLYPHTMGIKANGDGIDNSRFVTTGVMLQRAGYATAFVGKWHQGSDGSPQPGWDRWVSFADQGTYLDPVINIDGTTVNTTGHVTDVLTQQALDFINTARDQPFFLVLAHKAVHAPWVPQDRYVGSYAGLPVPIPESLNEDLSTKPPYLAIRQVSKDTVALAQAIRRYHETLAGVDESLGTLMDRLEELGILDSTLIIFVGDNGLLQGEHGLEDKRSAYEESIRVPLLLRYPEWFGGRATFTTLALNIDVAPTILDAAGVLPDQPLPGTSLRLFGQGFTRTRFLYEYFFEDVGATRGAPATPEMRAIRTYRYKYIVHNDEYRSEEAYDMLLDPHELHNLVFDSSNDGLIDDLRGQLRGLQSQYGDTGF